MQQKNQNNFDYDSESQNDIIVSTSLLTQHDSQFDYYGKRVATCNSKGKIAFFEIIDNRHSKQSDIKTA